MLIFTCLRYSSKQFVEPIPRFPLRTSNLFKLARVLAPVSPPVQLTTFILGVFEKISFTTARAILNNR